MRKILEHPWSLAIFVVVVVGIAVFGRASPLSFKNDILTQVMPSLLAGLFAIAAVVERAVAVLNNIWFGEQREKEEDKVRLINKQMQAARAEADSVRQARDMLVQEAIRTGNSAALADVSVTAPVTAMAPLDAKIDRLAGNLETADQTLVAIEGQQNRIRLGFGFAIALLVSAVGVRALQSMLDVTSLSRDQRGVFQAVDILLTAGLLAGGTSAIGVIADLLGTYVNNSRKRAMDRS